MAAPSRGRAAGAVLQRNSRPAEARQRHRPEHDRRDDGQREREEEVCRRQRNFVKARQIHWPEGYERANRVRRDEDSERRSRR